MAKNFDYILKLAEYVPGFKKLHDYCDKAESFQTTYPEESANNARKALEWLVKNMLRMKHVPMNERERLNELLRKPETAEFVNRDWRLDDDIRTVQKIGNAASHDGAEPIKRVKAFKCLRSLYNVVQGFMYHWGLSRTHWCHSMPPWFRNLCQALLLPHLQSLEWNMTWWKVCRLRTWSILIPQNSPKSRLKAKPSPANIS